MSQKSQDVLGVVNAIMELEPKVADLDLLTSLSDNSHRYLTELHRDTFLSFISSVLWKHFKLHTPGVELEHLNTKRARNRRLDTEDVRELCQLLAETNGLDPEEFYTKLAEKKKQTH